MQKYTSRKPVYLIMSSSEWTRGWEELVMSTWKITYYTE